MLATAVACASGTTTGWPVGSTYWATMVTDSGHVHDLAPVAVVLKIVDGGHITVDDGCNVGSFASALDGGNVAFTFEYMTQRGCIDPRLVDQATLVSDFFQGTMGWRRSGDQLVLTKASRVMYLVDRS
jgi:heat shock protein HslJ